ncbi:MAG: helix-turn-helix domain-containing protein [Chitinophagales bacterium]
MSVNLKIKQLREEKNLSQEDFGSKIGVKRASVGMIETGKQQPTIETLDNIVNIFGVDYNWLLGKSDETTPKTTPNTTPNEEIVVSLTPNMTPNVTPNAEIGIPLIPIEAMAGLGAGESTAVFENQIQERLIIPEFKGKVDFYIKVTGNSMYPRYQSGDIVACRYIKEITFIQWNKPYVLDTTQGALVKRLMKSGEPDEVICKSDNKDYPEFTVKLADIRAIALVVGVIRFE